MGLMSVIPTVRVSFEACARQWTSRQFRVVGSFAALDHITACSAIRSHFTALFSTLLGRSRSIFPKMAGNIERNALAVSSLILIWSLSSQ
jgi:hypothetical protein